MKGRSLFPLIVAAFCVMVLGPPGCAGKDPVLATQAQALNDGLRAIRPSVERDIKARSDPDPAKAAAAAAALGAPVLTPAQAAFELETLDYQQQVIDDLKARALGTVDPARPLPAGPTRAGVPSG